MATSKSEQIEENKLKGTLLDADCDVCKRENSHKILSCITLTGEEMHNDDFGVSWQNEYQIIRCGGCGLISFRETAYFSEDHFGDEDPTKVYLYPKRTHDNKQEVEITNFPDTVSQIYSETINAFNGDSFVLCAAGLRTIVEAICNDLGIEGGNVLNSQTNKEKFSKQLDGKINGLVEKQVLTKNAAQILHSHRFMGNKAVHEVKISNKRDLLIAIEIIEHLLQHIYDLPSQAETLSKRV